jgi:hypothetical protein
LIDSAPSQCRFALEIRHNFDPAQWETLAPLAAPHSTLLVTWQLQPEPTDAGMPQEVQLPFATALCALGPVLYAAESGTHGPVFLTQVPMRRGLLKHELTLFRASAPDQVFPAFETPKHNWSMNAQWLVVTDAALFREQDLHLLFTSLYRDWQFPRPWPQGVLIIVQAAVDGDGAACHCATREIENALIAALQRTVRAAGGNLSILD